MIPRGSILCRRLPLKKWKGPGIAERPNNESRGVKKDKESGKITLLISLSSKIICSFSSTPVCHLVSVHKAF